VRTPPRALSATLAAVASLCALAPGAQAAPSLEWSAAAKPLSASGAVSCASEALCAAVGGEGAAETSFDPGDRPPTWSGESVEGDPQLSAVSCAPVGPCVAVDRAGDAFVARSPGISKWSKWSFAGTPALTGVSCPSASLCVAVDEGGAVWTNTNGGAGGWNRAETGSGHTFTAISCGSASVCVAVDKAGEAVSSSDPTGGAGAWHAQRIDANGLTSVACASATLCVTVDAAGDALASSDPSSAAPSWTLTPIDGGELKGVSCASSGLCVAVGADGDALASDDASAPVPEWSSAHVAGNQLSGVSCLPGGLCVALDAAGDALAARAPAPVATTLPPTLVTSSTATLAGVVEARDAALGACYFEYGTTSAYERSVPCATTPTAISGRQEVSAQLGGLEANTTYHYRLVAVSARGASAGPDVSFITGSSESIPLVTPNPSISGTPAVGQKLACHANTPPGSSAQLSYAWVRDQIPIPGSESSTYTVKGQDSGHHLQCQVTATDGGGSVTKKSSFVTIPVGGAPVSAGETSVGGASFRAGRVSVPVDCSPHASGGCEVILRLTAVETLSGRRVVALAARAPSRPRTRGAGLRRTTVTLASARAHLPAGARLTLTAALSKPAKRLLAARKRFSAYLYVTGTVIGVIEAQLAQQLLTLSAPAASHGAAVRAGAFTFADARATSAPTRARAVAHTASSGPLAAAPYMGWDTYFALGGIYSEATVLQQASELKTLGLQRRGYRLVWLDVGWWHGTRGPHGEITVSAKQWPHGLSWLTRTLHAAGFLVGLYTDAGPNGCGGAGQGSFGHYQQDANTFAAWGFDAVKADFCGGAEHHLSPASAYAELHQALAHNSSHRPLLLNVCDFLQPEQYGEGRPPIAESAFASYGFGPSVANSWRTDTDVGLPGKVYFSDVLRNLDADAAAPQAAGPGHWNDPDYLAPDQGMSATQFRSQLSMWAMLAAPLMVSDNLEHISGASLQTLQNAEVLAIDQDPAGVQGTLLSSSGDGEVWVKPLVGGARAIALLNRGSSPLEIRTSALAAGLPAAHSYFVRDVWTHALGSTGGAISTQVPGDGTVLLRVAPR
jgi:Alpha galactosidase A/Alpha galactosidase C-terminal beta sandwich domain